MSVAPSTGSNWNLRRVGGAHFAFRGRKFPGYPGFFAFLNLGSISQLPNAPFASRLLLQDDSIFPRHLELFYPFHPSGPPFPSVIFVLFEKNT